MSVRKLQDALIIVALLAQTAAYGITEHGLKLHDQDGNDPQTFRSHHIRSSHVMVHESVKGALRNDHEQPHWRH